MWTWLFLFVPAFGLAKGLTDCFNESFNPSNIVEDQVTGIHKYHVYGIREYYISMPWGNLINTLNLLIIFSSIILVILSFFFAEHWWQGLIAIVGGFILRAIFRVFGDVQFRSFLYYVEVIACPVLIVLSYWSLFAIR